MGSGGGEIARTVAERLGYRHAGSEELAKVAARYGLVAERLAHFGEAKPSLLERLSAETRLYLVVIQAAVYELAEQDNVVLLGRGGQWLLGGVGHALRLRVIAPFPARVSQLCCKLAEQAQPVSPDRVREMVRRDDADKAGRARYLYDSELNDPALYDLVLNTETAVVDSFVQLVAQLVERPELAATPESRQLVADRALNSRVQATLLAAGETRCYRIEVEAKSGVVFLAGTADLEEAARVAQQVPGVSRVVTRPIEIRPIPPVIM